MWWWMVVLEFVVIQVAGGRLTRLGRPKREAAIVKAGASRAELPVHTAYDCGASVRLIRREHAAVLGLAFLWMAAIPVLFLTYSGDSSRPTALSEFLLVPLLIGIVSRPVSLTALMCWEVTVRRRIRGPRVARLTTPEVTDYVSPFTVWTTRLLAGVVVPAAAIFAWNTQSRDVNKVVLTGGEVIAVVALSWLCLVGVETMSLRLISLPQPAGTPLQLQWDDAIRAMQLEELHTSATMVSFLLLTVALSVLFGGGVAGYTLLSAFLVLVVMGGAKARYQGRLWPAVQA